MEDNKLITSNEVLIIFCAVMLDRGITSFKRKKLSKTIYEFKQSEKYTSLLSDIKYNSLDAYEYSRDLERSIMIFKLCGLIYHKGVDTSETFYISENINTKNIIGKYLNECDMIDAMVDRYLDNSKVKIK